MKIVNIGVLAHVDAGKTTTVERMLYECGAVKKPGSVDSGDTHTDWLAIERERGISVRAASVGMDCEGVRINVVDTPGHMDFTGEVERALLALDAAVLVISAPDGVEPQTEKFCRALREASLPCLLFVNKCDRLGTNLDWAMAEIRQKLAGDLILLSKYTNAGGPDFKTSPREFSSFSEEELFTIFSDDEETALALLDGARPTDEEIAAALARRAATGTLVPVILGSAMLGEGIVDLLKAITGLLSHREAEEQGEPLGIVYKVEHEGNAGKTGKMGKASHVRLFSGALRNRDQVSLLRPGSEGSEPQTFACKATQVRSVSGGEKRDTGLLRGGDIAAVYGLTEARAGDFIYTGDLSRISERFAKTRRIATPLMSVQVTANPERQSDLLEAVSELSDEDPLLDYEWNADDRELSIKIMGRIQIEVLTYLLKERYGLDASFSSPLVIYRETPSKSGRGYEAYTMHKPCWAIVELQIDPLPRGSGYRFESTVRDDKIFYRYQNHVALSVPETLKQGLHGWGVTDLAVTLIGGEHHTVHTHNMDFFLATPIAVMDGLQNCGTILLEPMLKMQLSADEGLAGKLIGDILAMRGESGSPVIRDGVVHTEAEVPAATSMDYPVAFASLTSGKGRISTEFAGYRECPLELGATRKRRGVNPLDRAKWILSRRGAVS